MALDRAILGVVSKRSLCLHGRRALPVGAPVRQPFEPRTAHVPRSVRPGWVPAVRRVREG